MRPALTRSSAETGKPKAAAGHENSGVAVRAKAAEVIQAVRIQGRSLTDALADRSPGVAARDESLLGELSYGTLRLLPRLESLADLLLKRPIKHGDQILRSLLLVGLYQLVAMRIPDHAAVSATVAATRALRRPHAAGLINATLRRFQRDRAAMLERVENKEPSRWLMPSWLLRRLRAAWPETWEGIAAASNDRPPMFLRINRLRTTTEAYLKRLETAHIEAEPLAGQPGALLLRQPIRASALPGFADGLVSVQDAGAQWAARLLNPSPGERVLDACAAPGGKTAHLLELAEDALDLTAVDVRPDRLEPLRLNLKRLGLHARVHAGDAARPDPQWATAPFHRILLDAPCSATGVIRRHPDIKQLRRDGDIAALARTQAQIIDALWELLAPGGHLLYVTCSVLPDENEQLVAGFLVRTPDARELALPHPVGIPRSHGRQLLPRTDGGDGFYFALLQKSAPATDAGPSGEAAA